MAAIFAAGDDPADYGLDVGDLLGGVFQARADGRAHMQGDLAGIDRGEEVRPQEREQDEGHQRPRP